MGRARKIMTDDILDAAERVVIRLGASGLSIGAVAQEAGVSKASVLYDHRSKSALQEALIDRRMKIETERQTLEVKNARDTPHPELFGRIKAAEQGMTHADRTVSIAISASVSQNDKVQKLMRDWMLDDLNAMSGGPKPEAALMAYMTLSGFCVTEFFALHQWTEEERAKILEGVRTIYATYPDK